MVLFLSLTHSLYVFNMSRLGGEDKFKYTDYLSLLLVGSLVGETVTHPRHVAQLDAPTGDHHRIPDPITNTPTHGVMRIGRGTMSEWV